MTSAGGHKRRRQPWTCACAALVTICAAGHVSAQSTQEPAGLETAFTYTERLLWDDGDTFARSDLGFSLTADTRRQSFALSLDGALEKDLDNGLKTTFEDPQARLNYQIESRNTALSFDAHYLRTDVDSLAFDEDLGSGTLVLEEGQRETARSNLRLEFGREAPIGATVALGYRETDYFDTTSTSLLDSTTQSVDVGLRMDVDRRISTRLTYALNDLNREGGVDSRRETFSLGATLDVTQALTADIDIGQSELVRSGSVARDASDGLYVRLALNQDRRNGTLRGSVVSNIDENGRRTTARVDRRMELRNGTLGFGFGLSESDTTGKTRPLYALNYAQDLPRGEFSVALDQVFSSTSTGSETLNSRLQLSLSQALTSLSSLNGTLTFRDSDVLSAGGTDSSQLNLDLSYAHVLTDDWSLVGGYTHSRRMRDSASDDIDDQIYIGLRTTLAWRP